MAKEYNIARSAGHCARCEKALEPNETFMATVVEAAGGLVRRDWCLACWDDPDRGDVGELFGQWRAVVPEPTAKKRLFVDDDVLVHFFHRLAGDERESRRAFRFVLTLVLMRKRLLTYLRSRRDDDGREIWTLRRRGDGEHEVVNPELDEDRIAEVSEQLSEILEGDLE
ncbi:MAG: hypothetical protein ACOC7R_03255 [Planctomycetota bacterium]